MPQIYSAIPTAQCYASLSEAYIELFGRVEQAEPEDRELIARWAQDLAGPVLDAGCGPGQWTHAVASAERPAIGVDMVPEFVKHAAANYPECTFQLADMSALPFPDGSFSGVLSWYSIIHTPPEQLPEVLNSLARVLQPGGALLLGFFAAQKVHPFEHKVAPAWYWPVGELSKLVEAAGFEIVDRGTRDRSGARCHGQIVAQRKHADGSGIK
ncbi:class I SAM-dependent methyltransferase [Glutamicibacter halophytocola]|uniref:class I SAM-dependent methyltransferase n=1 Tax=Glutamicibacter halophytocola TaxID=1933880 RepID=UPI00321C31DA